MGANQYTNTVPYNKDINSALQKIRQEIFDSGKFQGSDNGYSTIDDIFEDYEFWECGGTGTLIDITSISDDHDMGSASPMSPDELQKAFGTLTPTEEDLDKGADFFETINRGESRYIILYDTEGEPAKIHFAGYSID